MTEPLKEQALDKRDAKYLLGEENRQELLNLLREEFGDQIDFRLEVCMTESLQI